MQEGLRRRHASRKWLNENLRPLERYLAANVGRPWDKVYAEICAGIDRRNTVQQHIHQHLKDFVAIAVVDIDGVLCAADEWRGPQPLEGYWRPRFYVDPKSGLLRVNRWREKARREYRRSTTQSPHAASESRRCLDAKRQLHRIAGIWFHVELAPVAEAANTQAKPFDVLRQREPSQCPDWQDKKGVASNQTLFGRHDVYACRKRQLNARELRLYGLSNDNG